MAGISSAPAARGQNLPTASTHTPRFLSAVALALASTASVHAQSLDALYQAAKNYDATYLSARAQAESSGYRAAQADAKRLPTIGLSASATRSHVNVPPVIVGPLSVSTPAYNTEKQVALQAKQPLFNRSNTAQIDQAQRALTIAQADLQKAEQDLIVRVAQAYFDVLNAQDALATAQANHKAIAEQLASAQRNFEVGNATITDSREAQARSDLASAQEISANNDLRVKILALEDLVGRRGVLPKPLRNSRPLPSLQPADPEQWVHQSETAPDVRKAELAKEIAELEIDNAKAGRLPTVDLVGSYGRDSNNTSSLSHPAGGVDSSSIAVQLNMPLFTGFAVQNRIHETEVLLKKADFDEEAARRGTAQAVRTAYYGVESGLAQVKALEAAEASTKLALDATELGYRVGVRVNIDVLNAQTQLYSTQRDLSKARYDVIMGGLKLRQLSGSLNDQDLAAVNVLLVP